MVRVLGSLLLFAAAAVHAALPIAHWTTGNGARVYFVENHDLPILDVSVDFAAGSGRDAPATSGLAALTLTTMSLGAAGMSESEIARGFADVGAQFSPRFDRDRAGFTLRTLSAEKERGAALDLFAAVLQKPEFPSAVVEREKARVLAAIKEAESKPAEVADRAFQEAVFGGHPYALPEEGRKETVAGLDADRLRNFYSEHYTAANMVIALMGDLTRNQAERIAEDLAGGLPAGQTLPPPGPVADLKSANLIRIPFPSKQAHVLMGQPGMARGDPDYFPLYVGNYILGGGGFDSRLTDEVREKRGLSYSVYSYFLPLARPGPFTIGLQTRADQADNALQVATDTLDRFLSGGITDAELTQAKNHIIGGFPLRLDSNKEILEYLAVIGFYRLPLTYIDDFTQKVDAVTVAQIQDAFRRRLHPETMATVVVGAAAKAE
jgi:zinc protease